MNRKICFITGTRAEFGLMRWLMQGISQREDAELQIIATGMHLSPEFGTTYKQIEAAGLTITKKIEILLSSDTPVGISKSMGLAQISFAEAYQELQPDLIVVLGDRFETFAAAASALVCRIPIAHIHGGEVTVGAIDEAFRHSITKMAHLHFTSTERYRQRVIQLGEHPNSVFNVGSPGLDGIFKLDLLNKTDFEASINTTLGAKNILVTYHPVTLENQSAEKQFGSLLNAIENLSDTKIILTKPNADTDGRIIIKMIDEFVAKYPEKAVAFTSLGQLRYLSALQFMDVVLGNSSSGIIEVPSFKTVTINIGDRQKGRIRAASVIDCKPNKEAIVEALDLAFSEVFQQKLKTIENPYGTGGASKKIEDIIISFDIENILKKEFFDL